MHLIVDKARDVVLVFASDMPICPAGRAFPFSSKAGGFILRLTYRRHGTVEYVA